MCQKVFLCIKRGLVRDFKQGTNKDCSDLWFSLRPEQIPTEQLRYCLVISTKVLKNSSCLSFSMIRADFV